MSRNTAKLNSSNMCRCKRHMRTSWLLGQLVPF
jgi:hypothetical protein